MRPAPLWRRLTAMVYDAVLVIALWMAAALPVVVLHGGAIVYEGTLRSALVTGGFWLYLLAVMFGFYGIAWRRGGATLGMQTWRIRVCMADGGRVSWRAALLRFVTAAAGIANLWAALDPAGLGWHERLSGTRTVIRTGKTAPD